MPGSSGGRCSCQRNVNMSIRWVNKRWISQIDQTTRKSIIPKNWILLDTQSTVDAFHNLDFLEIIQTVDHRMKIQCNAGTRWTDQQGDLPGYGRVIRAIKQRMQGACTTVSFPRIPSRMIIELGKRVVFWLNAFPALDGISTTLSPPTVVTRQTLT